MLKKIAAHLVDVHGQSEHFFLLSENNQLSVIDSLCGQEVVALKNELESLLTKKKEYKSRILALGGSEQERAQRLDLLAYQINEIESAHIEIGETDRLKAKKRLIDNAEKVITCINAVKEILSSDNGCIDLLATAGKQMSYISDIDEQYAEISDRLDNLSIDANDLNETVSDIADNFSFDEDEARAIEERLNLLKSLTKKYGADEESILNFLDTAKSQYDSLNDAAAELERINKSLKDLDGEIFCVCEKLTEIRKARCMEFCSAVEEQLKSLNIVNARFYVEFTPYTQQDITVGSDGADKICFMFSANKGEPPKPLNKVISGGEMSRFMLAVKTQLKG
ncbi:MAG: hypothetical protein K2N23_02065, partial [Clostridia bacterium]|nr:hypothetical protein [Clostridia bacterium]